MASVQDMLKRHLENVKAKVAKAMADNGRNASGRSVASLLVEVSDTIGTLYGSKSFLVMEKARSPVGFLSASETSSSNGSSPRVLLSLPFKASGETPSTPLMSEVLTRLPVRLPIR